MADYIEYNYSYVQIDMLEDNGEEKAMECNLDKDIN